jgi:hypothetical protein
VRWFAKTLGTALLLMMCAPIGASAASPSVEPVVVDVTLRPDSGIDGFVEATWHAGDAPVAGAWKTIGHGARVLAVVDPASGRAYRYTSTEEPHESRVDVTFDPPLAPGETRTVRIAFDQTHVWHYDRATQTMTLNVPWVQSWEIDVRHFVERVNVPPELGATLEPNGWEVSGRTLIARRAEGAPRLTMQAFVPAEAVDQWTAPMLTRVPMLVWLALGAVLLAAALAAAVWLVLRRGGRTRIGDAAADSSALSPAAAAALLAPGNDRVLVEACLLTLVDRGAIRLETDAESDDVCAVELVKPDARALAALHEALFAGEPDGERRIWLSDAIERGLHRTWRAEVESDLGRAGMLQDEGTPGLDGLSYAGWAARERLRRELADTRPQEGMRGLATTAAIAGIALALGAGGGAFATLPNRIELESQELAIGQIVLDGTPLVRLHYAIARLVPLPPTHSHDYATGCGTGCGFGYFVGDHSCASSCGGVA